MDFDLTFDQETQQEKENRAAFAQALREHEEKLNHPKRLKHGTIITGTVSFKNDRYVLVNFHGKNDIRIDNSGAERGILETLEVGSEVSVMITEVRDKSGFEIYGSIADFKSFEVASFLNTTYNEKSVLTGKPTDMNHAGYNVLVNINDTNVSLFMPHLLADVNKITDQESLIGEDVEFMLEYVNKDGNKSFIASRKKYLETLIPKEMSKLRKGGIYDGFVTGVTSYGLFVQFGVDNKVLTGMIHTTNLLPEVQELLDRITPGYEVQFYVKDIVTNRDPRRNRVYLTQILKESLWDSISTGQKMEGTVSSVKDFGLMIDLDYETKGLLHKSVLDRPLDSYKKGETVNIKVTAVNKNNRQITLALTK
jgi:ribosomal protein S1